MEPCSLADVQCDFDDLVAGVASTQNIDPICSRSDWIAPAAEAFAARAKQHVFSGPTGHVALLEHNTPSGPVLSSFDSIWGFASPIISADPGACISGLRHALTAIEWRALLVSGVALDSNLFDAVQLLEPIAVHSKADRCIVDLSHGFDGWLLRRSPRFRRSVRTALKQTAAAGMTVSIIDDGSAEVVDRILKIEATSWKTQAGSGLVDTELGAFTQAMAARFAQRSALRVLIAQLDGVDVGYVIGGVVGNRYRGFQHSFDRAYERLSIGKALQAHNLRHLAGQGVDTYDMGMLMGYKNSYLDRIESTATLLVVNGS